MKCATLGLTLVYASLILIGLAFTSISHAEIDPETLIAAWLLDEKQGKEVKDQSENGNDGNLIAGKWEAGQFGNALDFDGKVNGVDIPESDSLNDVEDLSMLAWVYLRRGVTSGTWNAVVGKNPYPNGYLVWIQVPIEPAGLAYVGGARHQVVSGVQLDLKKWYHLAFTRAGSGDMKFYIDGKFIREAAGPKGEISTQPAPITIAGQSPQTLDGLVDEVLLFNTVLEADDIQTFVDKGFVAALAVSPTGKLATSWGQLKAAY